MKSYNEEIELANRYFAKNEFDLCIKTIEPLILNDDCPEILYILLSRCHRRQKKYRINEIFLRFLLQKYENSANIRIEYAENASNTFDFGEAILRWNYIIDNKLLKNFSDIYCRLSDIYITIDDIPSAHKYIDLALSIDNSYIKAINRKVFLDSYKAKKYIVTIIPTEHITILDIKNKSLLIKRSEMGKYNLNISILKPIKSIIFITETQEFESLCSDFKIYKDAQSIQLPCDIYNVKQIGVIDENNNKVIIYNLSRKEVFSVLEGSESWLFLDNDTNKSVEIYTGKIILNNEQKNDWKNYIKTISKIGNSLFLLTPAKETVFPQYYPHTRGDFTITTQFLDILEEARFSFIYPVEILKYDESTYIKTDTHWSDWGAFRCFIEITKIYNIDISAVETFSFDEKEFCGDLGSKLVPQKYSIAKFLNYSDIHYKEIFSNQVPGEGHIKILENDQAVCKKRVVIFGSSFSLSLYPFFSEIFSRTIFIRFPGGCIQEILDFEKPDFVIFETTERFLTVVPQYYNKISDYPKAKRISSLSNDLKNQLFNQIQQLDEQKNSIYINYVKSLRSL